MKTMSFNQKTPNLFIELCLNINNERNETDLREIGVEKFRKFLKRDPKTITILSHCENQ